MLLTGRQAAASVGQLDLREKAALYVPPTGTDTAAQQLVVEALRAATRWVVVADDQDSAGVAAAISEARQCPTVYGEEYLAPTVGEPRWPWTVAVH